MSNMFVFQPKLFTELRNYSKEKFMTDLMAGIIVGIVALPLAIAFGIASGVSPEKGLITAIIGGFIVSLLGGRAAEEMMLGDISTGASSDIQRATAIARKMVGTYGMSSRLGNVAFDAGTDEVFIGKSMAHTRPYSEKTAAEMDAEIRAIIDEAYEKCREILARYKTELTAVAEYLLEHETMDGDTFKTYFTQSGESRQ